MEYKLAVGFCDAWVTFLWGQKIIVCYSKIFTWDCRGKDEFLLKVAFFQKMRFISLKSPKKIIPKTILILKFEKRYLLIWAGISKFKLRIVFWEIWRFEHFLKKGTFSKGQKIPYSINQFLGWDIFCRFLKQDCSSFLVFLKKWDIAT